MPKETNNPGTGNKWTQVVSGAYPATYGPPPVKHEYCTCPELEGWSSEELALHQNRTSLTIAPLDCVCSLGNQHWLAPSPPFDNFVTCMCPSADGWSDEELHNHGTGVGFSAGKYHCFCSGPNRNYVHIFEPRPEIPERCLCPTEWGWFPQELEYHMAVSNRSATIQDCFCKNAQGYVVRHRPGVINDKLFDGNDSSIDSKNDFVLEAGDNHTSSTINPTKSQSNLTIFSLDGDFKEIKLGSLWKK